MRRILIVAALAACSTSSSPHDVVACVGYVANGSAYVGKCERACEMPTPDFTGTGIDNPCTASNPEPNPGFGGGTLTCERTATDDGILGCCMVATGPVFIRFYQCEGK